MRDWVPSTIAREKTSATPSFALTSMICPVDGCGTLRMSQGFSFDYAWETDEASAFVNIIVPIPEIVLRGQVKRIGLAGHNWSPGNLKSGAVDGTPSKLILRPEQTLATVDPVDLLFRPLHAHTGHQRGRGRLPARNQTW